MALCLGKSDRFGSGQFQDFSINADSYKPFAFDLFEHVTEFSGLVSDYRRDNQNARFFRVSKNLVDDLLRCLFKNLFTGRRVMRLSDGGKQDSEVVVNLCGRRDR